MNKEKLLDEENRNLPEKVENGTENEQEYRMGIGKWTPDWLQPFNSIKCFVVILCIASLTQGNTLF